MAAGNADPKHLQQILTSTTDFKKALPTLTERCLSLLHLMIGAPWRRQNQNESKSENQSIGYDNEPSVVNDSDKTDSDCRHCLSLLASSARYVCLEEPFLNGGI